MEVSSLSLDRGSKLRGQSRVVFVLLQSTTYNKNHPGKWCTFNIATFRSDETPVCPQALGKNTWFHLEDTMSHLGIPLSPRTSNLTTTRGLLVTDYVILNHGQVTWTTSELAILTTIPTGGRLSSRQI
ncbi:hypothetical protein TNCV_1611631 [Trichonephila clavipes]|nr:hypothetical protein TNCV_1611631 [Trichonephila clavipes]